MEILVMGRGFSVRVRAAVAAIRNDIILRETDVDK